MDYIKYISYLCSREKNMLNVNQMTMKNVLNITEHKDGSYTLNHLTYEQMHAIQSALSQRAISLGNIKKEMQAEGLALIPRTAYSLQFADDASDQLLDMGF